ncbi:hypothetical protein SAMN06265371_10836 [Lutibacter agarilyticus]|uniref:Uncharacterized protein n=1 Tax=Lutibacter agarilyticus TaxID=1109740 RepID=A0A238Y5T5_9FLAO|nr:hypothetical protein SAMN06265371_10836 [Lutibacter agarilyticus]
MYKLRFISSFVKILTCLKKSNSNELLNSNNGIESANCNNLNLGCIYFNMPNHSNYNTSKIHLISLVLAELNLYSKKKGSYVYTNFLGGLKSYYHYFFMKYFYGNFI